MTLTCQVTEYYPDMKVFFLHGSNVVEPLNEREINNTDGTKNKTVTIVASGSIEFYTCIASNIPGTRLNQSSSVLLHSGEPIKITVVVIIGKVLCKLFKRSFAIKIGVKNRGNHKKACVFVKPFVFLVRSATLIFVY